NLVAAPNGNLETSTVRAYICTIGVAAERSMRAFATAEVAYCTFDHGCTGTGLKSDVGKVGAVSPRPFLLSAYQRKVPAGKTRNRAPTARCRW
ncbi:hypothetical protein, partial [Rhizobium leguminosarum]|uniref:hypothetical protein n=1 Tax=Rhizobium leguminosarum TaxID=384 RepID=UPI001C972152